MDNTSERSERRVRRIAAGIVLVVGLLAVAAGATIKHVMSGSWPTPVTVALGALTIITISVAIALMPGRARTHGQSPL